MLEEYEADNNTGMDVHEVARSIHEHTSGHPSLVSQICALLDARKSWTPLGAGYAARGAVSLESKRMKDLFEYIRSPLIFDLTESIVLYGRRRIFSGGGQSMKKALKHGLVKDNGGYAALSNRVFEMCVTENLAKLMSKAIFPHGASLGKKKAFSKDCLDMTLFIERCAKKFLDEHPADVVEYYEDNCHLAFFCCLNATLGKKMFSYVDVPWSKPYQIILRITAGSDVFFVQLAILDHKIGRHEEQRAHFAQYLKNAGAGKGFILTYDLDGAKGRKPKHECFRRDGVKMFELTATPRILEQQD
jgi:hypothetical protein